MPSLLSQMATARSTIRYDSACSFSLQPLPPRQTYKKNTEKLSFLRVFLINQAFLFYFIGRASCIKLRTVFSLLN